MELNALSQLTARVHDDDAASPPPHPGPGWTRFVCISDTHSRKFQIPEGDVLLHSGDLSQGGSLKSLTKTIEWLISLPHPTKIVTAGNHDMCLDEHWVEGGRFHRMGHSAISREDFRAAQELVHSELCRKAGLTYLEHQAYTFKSSSGREWRVYGSPAAQVYSTGAFQYEGTREAKNLYNKIPLDTEILLTHTPPFGTLDTTRGGNSAGCKVLTRILITLDQCRLHLFGHIHESHGAMTAADPNSDGHQKVSVNGALGRWGAPIVVDLKN